MGSDGPRYIVGIDLGTTHTVVAFADTADSEEETPPIRGMPVVQLVAPGQVAAREMLPSVRYHAAPGELAEADRGLPWDTASEAVVGQLALSLGAKVPGRVVSSAKSWLSHGAVDRTARILPWGSSPDVPKVSPVAASASYLAHVAAVWDHEHPTHPLAAQEVVLTVPASFDEAARSLTLAAARDAGIERLRLVEEPQAAFYDWLDRHREDLETHIADTKLAIVIDVGGGTTDLTLLQIELRDNGPRITRIAVGEHLMLGGDNMDLALARRAESRISGESQLGTGAFSQLLQQCRSAKERLLQPEPPRAVKVTVLGSGSKLVGGARSTEMTRDEVHELVLDGFLPRIAIGERPSRRRSAIVEFGLPYVADPAITRHVAAFLAQHADLAREALVHTTPADGATPVPDAVLLNGGVFGGAALAERMVDVLASWRGERPRVLANDRPELAVARGAVAYGLARRGLGLRIGGGSARSYFLAVPQDDGVRRGVCLLPRGAEEGEEIRLSSRTFSLGLGRPVRFPLVSSSADVRHHRPGDVVEIEGDEFADLPPIAAVLESPDRTQAEVDVQLVTALTEVGTLEMSCVSAQDSDRRWKLEFQLRGEVAGELRAQRVTQLHPRFAQATDLVRMLYGKSSQEVDQRRVKTLRSELERILGERTTWDTPLLRELFGALLSGLKRRRRSAAHERVWFNLTGYALRPGFGYPLDEWRIAQLWTIFDEGVQFMPEAQNQAEWWIMWRRVAGGLDAAAQERILDSIEWYLHPPTPRPRQRPPGPKKLAYDDMVRLAGSLERLPPERKTRVGDYIVERLTRHGENPQSWWSVGRLGARVPFHGSAHGAVPTDVAERWLRECLSVDWSANEHASFAGTLLGRRSGDRTRDVTPELAEKVATRLDAIDASPSWRRMVQEVTHLDAADERRVFGESLPPGLRLVD